MAHGAPDHRLVIDLVELVKLIQKIERITRIDSIDSLGEITIAKVVPLISPPLLLLDQFDDGILKWTGSGDGRLELSNTRAFSGSGSLRLHTGPDTGELQIARRKFAVSTDLTMRAVLRLALPSSGADRFYLVLTNHTPTQSLQANVKYEIALKKWIYFDSAGTPQYVPGGSQDLKLDPNVWHRLELECNFATGKYVRLVSDALTMDMSGIDLYDTLSPDSEHADLATEVCATNGQVVDMYVDDVYVEAW